MIEVEIDPMQGNCVSQQMMTSCNKESKNLKYLKIQLARSPEALRFVLCEVSLRNKPTYPAVLANHFNILVTPLAKVLNYYGHLSKAMYQVKAQKEVENEAGRLTLG